ncbi:MAG: stage II sporulation protein R [Clostridia bacterium]|nr:stage II sporulation protein R [Clostridia bacterium]
MKTRTGERRPARRGGKTTGAFAAILLLFAGLLLAVCPVAGEEKIYSDVIRLHVLAASDSAEDQADKIAVRDAILSEYGDLFDGFSDRAGAEAALTEDLRDAIRVTAESTLAGRGNPNAVSVTLSEEDYPTRDYGGFSLPAGRYLSLRVVIGTGEGKNWWCVLFPPLCTAASVDGVPIGLSDAEYRLMTEGKKSVRFKTLELVSRWFSR